MTTRLATSDGDFATKLAASATGDTVQLADSVAFGELTILASTADGVIVRSQSVWGCTVERITLQAVLNVQIRDIFFQMVETEFPPSGQVTPLLNLFASGSVSGLVVDGCKFRSGYAPDSFADFDPTDGSIYADYIGDGATSTWSGTPGVPSTAVNPFTNYPYAIGSTNGVVTGDLTFTNNVFTDMSNCLVMVLAGGYTYKVRLNRFVRAYGDCIRMAFPGGAFPPIVLFDVTGNEFEDCAWAQPQDNENPHGDTVQLFTTDNRDAFDSTTPFNNLVVAGNISWYHPGYRGQIQRIPFLSDVPPGYPFVAPIVVDNLSLSRITNKGVTISNSDCGSAFAYVYRNTNVANPENNFPLGNELYTNPVSGVGNTSAPSDATISVFNDPDYNGSNFIGRNIAERVEARAKNNVSAKPNVTLPRGTTATSYAAVFDPPADWDAVDTAEKVIDAFTPNVNYQGYGAVRQGDDLATFLARWSGDVKPYSDLPSYVGLTDRANLAKTTLTASVYTYVHAGKTTRAISITDGEYNLANDQDGTGAAGWTSAAGTVADGKYVAVRRTTSSLDATTVTTTLTVGDESFIWRATTIDPTNYPLVQFDGTQLVRQASAEALGSAAGAYATVGIELVPGSIGTAQVIWGVSAGSGSFSIQLLATGKLRFAWTNSGAGVTARVDTVTALVADTKYRILVTVDTTQATALAGIRIFVNDNDDVGTFGTWNQNVNIDWTRAPGKYQVGGNASTPAYIGQIGMIYISDALVDISDQAVRDQFSASYMGTLGEGPSGSSPRTMLAGIAATWNAGDPNRGTGTTYSATTGTVTAVGTDIWPPVLRLSAVLSTVAPYVVGQPIDIAVAPLGTPAVCIITASANHGGDWAENPQTIAVGEDGITMTFTPTEVAAYTISFINGAGYVNPANLTFDVASSGSPPTTFTQVLDYASIALGRSVTVTYTLDHPADGNVVITPSKTVLSGSFVPATVTITTGNIQGEAVFTPDALGTGTLTATNGSGLANPPAAALSVNALTRGSMMRMRMLG